MNFILFSASLVGFIHSLSPGHWLPVVLVGKSKKWSAEQVILGAVIAASGHVVVSNLLGLFSLWLGSHFFISNEEEIEKYGGLILVVFGLIYSLISYIRGPHHHHHHCEHDPEVIASHQGHHKTKKAPFLFLFSLGFSPCVAVLPIFVTATGKGALGVIFAMISFSVGVIAALVGASLLVYVSANKVSQKNLLKLNHSFLEHYGDVITGLSIVLMGALLFFL